MNTGFSFDLTPTEAIAFLRNKARLAQKLNLPGMQASARANATRIRNLTSLEMTSDIYNSLANAREQGIPFQQWKKNLMAEFERKGWVVPRTKGKEVDIVDPKTGEIFGTPRRLALIYRVNTTNALQAARYQQFMDNVDNRPYWQYVAILDSRTRPTHSAMHGKVFRYDDPFWTIFYPPNGFNCRCTVRSFSKRDLQRRGLKATPSDAQLEKSDLDGSITYRYGKNNVFKADKGFDYNVGRTAYKPNLDLYPAPLAQQFAKVDMTGAEFRFVYERIEQAVKTIIQGNQRSKKLNSEQMLQIRNHLSREYKFAAGVMSRENQTLLKSDTRTVWISDDTLIKQANSRVGDKYFDIESYGLLPEIIGSPDWILRFAEFPNREKFYFIKEIKGQLYFVVMKYLKETNELFAESFRLTNIKEVKNFQLRYETIK